MGVTTSTAPDPKDKSFPIDSSNELTLVGADAYRDFSVANDPEVTVMYDATTSDGHRFIVFYPAIDYREETLRVFYGTDDRLVQRRVIELSQSRNGSASLVFDRDGIRTQANMTYQNEFSPGGQASLQELDAPNTTTPMTAVPGSPGTQPPPQKTAAELTQGLQFVCF